MGKTVTFETREEYPHEYWTRRKPKKTRRSKQAQDKVVRTPASKRRCNVRKGPANQRAGLSYFQKRSCTTKIRYGTMQEAEHFRALDTWRYGTKLRPYKCSYCQGYHLSSRATY